MRGVAMAMQTVLDDLGKGLGLYVLAEMIAAWGRCVPPMWCSACLALVTAWQTAGQSEVALLL